MTPDSSGNLDSDSGKGSGNRDSDSGKGAKNSNVTRLMNLLFFLKDHGRGATARQIRDEVPGYDPAQKDEAFKRQFRRDREKLASMGFCVEQRDGIASPVYTLDLSSTKQDDLALAPADIALLRICAKNALANPGFLWKSDLASALGKLGGRVGSQDAGGAGNAHVESARNAEDGETRLSEQIAETVRIARRSRSLMVFDYQGENGLRLTRRVVPIKVFRYLGDMYLMAYDADRDDSRRFRFDRFLGEPGLDEADPKTLEAARAHLDDDTAVLPFQIGEQSIAGKIYFSKSALHKAKKIIGPALPACEPHGDGIIWNVDVANTRRLAQWVVENGPGILPIEPVETLDIIRKGLAKVRDDG